MHKEEEGILLKKYYRYNLFINVRAIMDFLDNQHDQSEYSRNKNFCKDICILSFIIAIYKEDKVIKRYSSSLEKYIYISDNFIIKNLPWINIRGRSIKYIIGRLESAGTIERICINGNQRFVKVNTELLDLWWTENYNMTATSYMQEHRPELWDSIKNEWMPILGVDNFKEVIDWCNGKILMKEIPYNNYESICSILQNTLNKWKPNKYVK